MKLPYSEPEPAGSERARQAKAYRELAAGTSRDAPHALTRANGEEADHGPPYPANFTKGLAHDDNGILADPDDYRRFVKAINSPDHTLFEDHVRSAVDTGQAFRCCIKKKCKSEPGSDCEADGCRSPKWRGWESPRAGHAFDLEGPDAAAVGMAPAPRVGSSELSAEMAELYALAILRDVPFTTIRDGGKARLCGSRDDAGDALLSSNEIVQALNTMPFFSGNGVRSSTPGMVDNSGLNEFERRRRFARTLSGNALTLQTAFRGSTEGAQVGPYVSQFMLIGWDSRAGTEANAPGRWGLNRGFIP
jgi:hypothetical protein